METESKVKILNQPIESPWTSTAPMQSMNKENTRQFESNKQTKESDLLDKKINLDRKREGISNARPSSNQFFHFLRLMQLFPNVHPATLHTVMTLCKNDFFIAVDKLIYAKKCKELYQNRRHLVQKNFRYNPYVVNHNQSAHKPQVIKLDSKRMTSRNRYPKNTKTPDKQGTCNDLGPVSLQCNVPLEPLSPAAPENLSGSGRTDNVPKGDHLH